jgi:predicted kinase
VLRLRLFYNARSDMTTLPLAEDVERILAELGPLPPRRPRPALVMTAGLPGSGKSRFCRELHRRTGAVILESDALRRAIFGQPDHSQSESRRLFAAIHAAIERLLRAGIHTILDATNLAEWQREPVYSIAERTGARLVLIWLEAPPEVAQARLADRGRGIDPQDRSTAGLAVYKRMRTQVEEIQRPHRVIDTSRSKREVLDAIAEEMESA